MIPIIGIVIALYVVARLIPDRWGAISAGARGLAAIAAAAAAVYLGSLGLGPTKAKPEDTATAESESALAGTSPDAAPQVVVTRASGGSIRTPLAYGIVVAKGSGLTREWIAITDSRTPVALSGTPGVRTIYKDKDYGGDYYYSAEFSLDSSQPVSAVEVRFLLFDVWGDHTRTLSFQHVKDLQAGVAERVSGLWSIYSETEVESHYASIGFIAKVRLMDGTVIVTDPASVIAEAKKFSEKFVPEDLETTPIKPPTA